MSVIVKTEAKQKVSALTLFEPLIIALIAGLAYFVVPYAYMRDILLFSVYTLGFDILYGLMGWLSFGQPLYLGVGAYATALFLAHVSANPFAAIAVGVLSGVLLSVLLSPLLLRYGGAYFSLLCLAFNALFEYLLIIQFGSFTGGYNGMYLPIEETPIINLSTRAGFYTFAIASLILVLYFYIFLSRSQFGVLFQAIKNNEEKVRFLGYNPFTIKLVALAASTLLSSLAGALFAVSDQFVTYDLIDPTSAIYPIIADIVGGPGVILGPIVGSIVFVGARDFISQYTAYWELILGAITLLIMFKFDGLVPLISKLRGK